MSNLSLCEITQSQLSRTPIIPGQFVCCLDTGNFYRDRDDTRVSLGADITFVSSLPLAPIANKLYLLKPDKLYLYDTDWIQLNEAPSTIVTSDSIYDFPSVGSENIIYIAQAQNKTYRWSDTEMKFFCIGSDYNDIKVINGGSASGE